MTTSYDLPAFKKPYNDLDRSHWSLYNPKLEFERQGVGSRNKAWRFTQINSTYSVSIRFLFNNTLTH